MIASSTRTMHVPRLAGTLLDSTLVVFLSECGVGFYHAVDDMPVLLAGANNWGLQTGQQLHCGGQYMNDVWAAVCGSLGLEPSFGADEFSSSAVAGLFAAPPDS